MAAAGSITDTSSSVNAIGQITKHSIAWTSDAGGAVSGNTISVQAGRLRQVKFIPDGTTAPTDLYDVTLLDADGADVLVGNGANQSATVAAWYLPANPIFIDAGDLTPTIANAGNAKKGTIILYIGP